MKKINIFLAAVFSLFAVSVISVSCESSDEAIDSSAQLDISGEFLNLKFDGGATAQGEEQIVIFTTASNWTAVVSSESGTDWVNISQTNGGQGINKISLSVEANTTDAVRSAVVTVQSGNVKRDINIEQSINYFMNVSTNFWVGDGRAYDEVIIRLHTNIEELDELKYTNNETNWLSLSGVGVSPFDDEEYIYKFAVEKIDEGLEERSCEVTFINSEFGLAQVVEFAQTSLPTITLDDESPRNLNYYDTSAHVSVSSNVEYTTRYEYSPAIVAGEEWLSETISEQTHSYTLQKNTSSSQRSVTIYYEYDNLAEVTKSITITQAGKTPILDVKTAILASYPYTKGEVELTIESNMELEQGVEEQAQSWLSMSLKSKEVNSQGVGDDMLYVYTVEMLKNEGNVDRDGDLSFTYDGLITPKTINILQTKENKFIAIQTDASQLQALSYEQSTTFDVIVKSNEDVLALGSLKTWISQAGAAIVSAPDADGVYTHTYTFELEENVSTTAIQRTQSISFTSASIYEAQSIDVVQTAKVPFILDIAALGDNIGFNGDNVEIEVVSNVVPEFDVTQSAAWITMVNDGETNPLVIINEDGSSTFTFRLNVAANNQTLMRNGNASFKNAAYALFKSVAIAQDAMPATAIVADVKNGKFADRIAELQADATLGADLSIYERIIVSGAPMNNADFTALKTSFPNAEYIDLSGTLTTTVPDNIFNGNTIIKQVVLPSTITKVGLAAFRNCPNLESVNLSEGLTEIGQYAFASSGITSVTIPSTLTKWGVTTGGDSYAFQKCAALKEVILSEGLSVLAPQVFVECGVENITIPASITTWTLNSSGKLDTFKTCKSLVSVVFSDGLVRIPSSMFSNSGTAFTVTSLSQSPPEIVAITYTAASEQITEQLPVHPGAVTVVPIYVPAGYVDAYKAADG